MSNKKSAEQQARDLLERYGVEDAQSWSAGDLVELANLIAGVGRSEWEGGDMDRWQAMEAAEVKALKLERLRKEGREWVRPEDEHAARLLMIDYEKIRDYENAALAAIACADLASTRHPGAAASYDRQALVYATLAAKK